MHMRKNQARTHNGDRRHAMFIFLVQYWVPMELYDHDIFGGLYAVRAKNVEDCVELLFQKYGRNTRLMNTTEKLRVVREQIQTQVMVSVKVKMYHRYKQSKVLEEYTQND